MRQFQSPNYGRTLRFSVRPRTPQSYGQLKNETRQRFLHKSHIQTSTLSRLRVIILVFDNFEKQ